MKNESTTMNRRKFIGKMATAGAAGLAFPFIAPSTWAGSNGPALRVAMIGVGGIGRLHAEDMERLGAVCSCFAEVDTRRVENATSRWPKAKAFQDYRKLFDEMHREFDAVMIATPDHHHFPASMLALSHDKHCYTQKPLTHSIGEARLLNEAAARKKVATQMGNQGHANLGNRLIYSWVKSGMIGDLKEVHCWTNRPVWPQGLDTPEGEEDVPPEFDWDVFLGPAPERPFNHEPSNNRGGVYHAFNWRGWWDFGGGALGDMAAHTMDGFYWSVHPRQPTAFEMVKTSGFNGVSFPERSIIRLIFGEEDGKPELPVYWYSGGEQPERPRELEEGQELPNTGALLIGSKATILSSGDYGESPRIIPREKFREIGRPELLLDLSPGHAEEWFMACRGEKPLDFPKSNFSYAGPFTEVMNLGVLAHQLKEGERAHWDSKNVRVTDRTDLNKFVHKTYREGWYFEL